MKLKVGTTEEGQWRNYQNSKARQIVMPKAFHDTVRETVSIPYCGNVTTQALTVYKWKRLGKYGLAGSRNGSVYKVAYAALSEQVPLAASASTQMVGSDTKANLPVLLSKLGCMVARSCCSRWQRLQQKALTGSHANVQRY